MVDAPAEPKTASLTRQLAWYFGRLIAVCGLGLVVFWPGSAEQPNGVLFAVVMFAPTVGALLAKSFGGGGI